jgi:hypothetical protein
MGRPSQNPRGQWKYPKNLLPLEMGTYPYRLPKRAGSPPTMKGRRGYGDRKKNKWLWRPAAPLHGDHWDVIHRNGFHSNIDSNGEHHHGSPPHAEFF